MKEKGFIVKTEKGKAVVRFSYKNECEKCGMCLKKDGYTEITAENGINAAVGDEVVVETKKEAKFTATVLVFLIPLFLLAAGVMVGIFLKSEILATALGLGTVILWYIILAIIDKKFFRNKDFCPTITEIVKEKENG